MEKEKFVVIFLARVLSIPLKRATHCKEQNKKRIMIFGWKTKKLFSQKMSKKCPKTKKFKFKNTYLQYIFLKVSET